MNIKAYIKKVILSFSLIFLGMIFLGDKDWFESLFIAAFTAIFVAFLYPGVINKVDGLFYKLLENVTGQKIDRDKSSEKN